MKSYGTTVVEVSYKGMKNRLPLLVVKGSVPMQSNVRLENNISFMLEEAPLKLKELITEFDSVFSEEIGCLEDFK